MSAPGSREIVEVEIDAGAVLGPLETWRQGVGHGGINPLPLPEKVAQGTARLRPRLVRIFIQEFFRVYPEHDRFDWSRLDPYMERLAETGAKVMAAICIKPPPLYPAIDHAIWRPSDPAEWQRVVTELVRRYSVERPLVTHWEIGNELDIGEHGGSPYLITDGEEYGEYFTLTAEAVRRVFPQARVGGPAAAGIHSPMVNGFLRYCARTGTGLDFLSWHLYHSDPGVHLEHLRYARRLVAESGVPAPELMVTEWSRRLFDGISVEDDAFDPRRAAVVAFTAIRFLEAGLDGSFYYHLWDQACLTEDFRPFFSQAGLDGMLHHWNEVPHRLGLFGVNAEPRPQYFACWMLSQLEGERLACRSGRGDLAALAGRDGQAIAAVLANYSIERSIDRVAAMSFAGLIAGVKRLTVWRVDADRRWDEETLELRPVEQREVDTGTGFACQVLVPADSVVLVRLEPSR